MCALSCKVLASLGRALNAGAIVYVRDGGPMILSSLKTFRAKRFRISYLLAPLYGLPLRLGKAVALSTILGTRHSASDSQGAAKGQLSFLVESEE